MMHLVLLDANTTNVLLDYQTIPRLETFANQYQGKHCLTPNIDESFNACPQEWTATIMGEIPTSSMTTRTTSTRDGPNHPKARARTETKKLLPPALSRYASSFLLLLADMQKQSTMRDVQPSYQYKPNRRQPPVHQPSAKDASEDGDDLGEDVSLPSAAFVH